MHHLSSIRFLSKFRPYVRSARDVWRRLCGETDANTTIIFAVAFIPMIGLVGAAVDYSRANTIRTAMQAAVDSTALAVSKNATTLSAAALQTQATTYFNASFTRKDARNIAVTATYSSTNGSQVAIKATATMTTSFMGVLGINQMSLGVASTTAWGNVRLRVALVLDNTGSMAQSGKMSALQTATKQLLTQLKTAATNAGDVYVSIIPFVKDVSVPPSSNYTASWIDWTDWQAEPQMLDTSKSGGAKPSNWFQVGPGSSCPFTSYGNNYGFNCVSQPAGTSSINTINTTGNYAGYICPGADDGSGIDSGGTRLTWKNGIKYNGCYNSWTKCVGSACACTNTNTSQCNCTGSGSGKTCTAAKIGSTQYYDHTWRPSATGATYTPALALDSSGSPYATPPHSTWNGCLTDRGSWSGPDTGNYDTNTNAVTSTPATQFPAEQYGSCPLNIMALNYDWTGMSSFVDSMQPNGSTNQNIGLVHGWQSLVGGGPYPTPPVMDSRYNYQQVIVLLSDGLNTQDRWYGDGSSTSTSVDNRQYLTCANAKAAKFTIYTVQVNTGGDPTSSLLKTCASSADKFFLVTSASGIGDVFTQIGNSLSQLRVAK